VTTHANTQTWVIARDDTDEGWTETTPPRSPAATTRPTPRHPARSRDARAQRRTIAMRKAIRGGTGV
jgi:hypothetical protein